MDLEITFKLNVSFKWKAVFMLLQSIAIALNFIYL
ncbi:hypothetical protein JOD21_003816 [Jeotgalibacillus terrae]|nr:hypothetical protein [Jeotgalibacillus terrae]